MSNDYYREEMSIDVKCDNCKYTVALSECKQYDCMDCGKYNICEYCFLDYMDKNDQQNSKNGMQNSDSDEYSNEDQYEREKKIQCIYCWSRKTLVDICVKTMKQFGYSSRLANNKIPIS
jgi:hypothetical protein